MIHRTVYRKVAIAAVCSLLTASVMFGNTKVFAHNSGSYMQQTHNFDRTFVLYETEGGQESAAVDATGLESAIQAPSVVLMEQSTGTVIYEKASHEQLRPASITKIMTLILIFDALKEEKIKLEDMVTTSEHAASMGGSQVFLEPGEQQTVDTMIKCIAVASANDACVAYRYSRQRRIF